MLKTGTALTVMMLWSVPLFAESYSWIDENGTYNFTEDYSSVPKKYRSKVDKRGDMGASPTKKESAAAPKALPGSPAKDATGAKPESAPATYGGKSYDQWRQEISERDEALTGLRKKIEEYDAALKKPEEDAAATRSLKVERYNAAQQYSDQRKQYEQLLDAARKAGLTIEVK